MRVRVERSSVSSVITVFGVTTRCIHFVVKIRYLRRQMSVSCSTCLANGQDAIFMSSVFRSLAWPFFRLVNPECTVRTTLVVGANEAFEPTPWSGPDLLDAASVRTQQVQESREILCGRLYDSCGYCCYLRASSTMLVLSHVARQTDWDGTRRFSTKLVVSSRLRTPAHFLLFLVATIITKVIRSTHPLIGCGLPGCVCRPTCSLLALVACHHSGGRLRSWCCGL